MQGITRRQKATPKSGASRKVSRKVVASGRRIEASRIRGRHPRKNISPAIQPVPGFAPLDVVAHGYSLMLQAILDTPRKKRIKIVNALFQLLEEKNHVLDRVFFPEEGWKELVTYLLDAIQMYCGEVPIFLVQPEDENNKNFWVTNEQYHGHEDQENALSLFEVAMLGRHERELHDLMVGALGYLIFNKGIIYWGNDGFGGVDMMIDHMASVHDNIDCDKGSSDQEKQEQKRSLRQALSRYTSGLPCDYEVMLSRKAKSIVHKIKERLSKISDEKEIQLWKQFLEIAACKETLDVYKVQKDEDSDESEPVSVNYAFRVYWRQDALYHEQADYINSCHREFGTQELITSHTLIDNKGNIDWNIKHQCKLPEMLRVFFYLFDSFIESKLKPYERPARNNKQ